MTMQDYIDGSSSCAHYRMNKGKTWELLKPQIPQDLGTRVLKMLTQLQR
jgi:hypothetical protein